MGGGWPDNHGLQIPTISTDALDRSHSRSLDTRISIVLRIILTYKDFDGAGHRKHDSSLVHIIDILCQNNWIL